jgi:hypothetical protein
MADQEGNKKTIDNYKSDYEFFTGKASDINRSLGLGGIAIIWIFKTTSDQGLTIPTALLTPLIWLVAALALDLLQYVVGGIIWLAYYRYKEYQIQQGTIQPDEDIKAPNVLPLIIHFLYWSKLIATIFAYYLLITFLIQKFIESPII